MSDRTDLDKPLVYPVMTGGELRAIRQELGLTQFDAAKKFEVQFRTYKNYELGATPIPGPVRLLAGYFIRDNRNFSKSSA
jgi:transcriptional regulator with XRE-family HTH domain